jgi:hypothetical protein
MLDKRVDQLLCGLFFSVVIVLGESFKIGAGELKISLPMLLFFLFMAFSIRRNLFIPVQGTDLAIYCLGGLFLIFAVVGVLSGNAIGDILEDAYPFGIVILLHIVLRSWPAEDLLQLWRLMIVMGILAAGKVMLIAVLPYDFAWDNNWQAAKEPLPLNGFYRIILRGGDIFISFSLVYGLVKLHLKSGGARISTILAVLLTLIAVFISLSRSSFLADGVAIAVLFTGFYRHFSSRKVLVFGGLILILLIALLPFMNAISLASSIFEARKDAFDADDVSVTFRENENNLILDQAAARLYLGNGLGSYFYMNDSGSEKTDGRSIYAHNIFFWLLLKTGVLGIAVFIFIYFSACRQYWQFLRHYITAHWNSLSVFTLFAGGIIILIISLLANKFSTLGGAAFFGLFTACSQAFRPSYERSN